VRSKAVRHWLTLGFYKKTRKAPSNEALQSALGVLDARALFEGTQEEVHLRTAWHDGVLYYDLADSNWRAVRIDKTGWQLIHKPSVRFRRYSHTATQVEPKAGGSIDLLWNFLNVPGARDRRLLSSWLCTGLIPDIPRPLLVLHGDQGSAKSNLCKFLLALLDPSTVPCLTTKNGPELIQGLAHRFGGILDNVSTIPEWLSDLLCRAVTGEGFTKRQLFTDDDDVVYRYMRLLLFNGINVAISKADLLDRCLIIGVERISEETRKDEKTLWKQFEGVKPLLLGTIFDHLAAAMREFSNIKPSRLPRMADFARWGMAIAAGQGKDPEGFTADFAKNVERQNEEAIEGSVTATVTLNWLQNNLRSEDDSGNWSGEPHELHRELKAHAESLNVPDKHFPPDAATLSKKLREVRPNLLSLGWSIDFGKGRRRRITIQRISPKNAVSPDAAALSITDSAPICDTNDGCDSKTPVSSD